MKSSLFTLFSFFLISSSVSGQAAIVALIFGDKVASEKFNISLEAGVGSAFFSEVETDFRIGGAFQFGIGANIKLNDNWSISPNAYFLSTRNITLKDAPVFQGESVLIQPEFADARITVKYIDVPLFVYYRFNNSRFRIGIAPQISFRTNARAGYEFDTLEESYSATIKESTEPIDFGLVSAVSYVLGESRSGKGLIFSLRYYQGFTDVYKDSYQLLSSQNRSSYIGIAASFPFVTDEIAAKNLKDK
jgi:hypothetical protein